MHELSIAGSVLETVRKEAAARPGSRVTKVGIKLGEFSGVDRESLSFCFEALVKDSDLDPLQLDIEFDPQGDQLDLAYLEVELDACTAGT